MPPRRNLFMFHRLTPGYSTVLLLCRLAGMETGIHHHADLLLSFSLEKMKKLTGFELPKKVSEKFDKLESDGLIRIDKRSCNHQIQLTERGILLADSIIFEAVEPLL